MLNTLIKMPKNGSTRSVFLKVGGMAPLGAILIGKGAKKTKGQ